MVHICSSMKVLTLLDYVVKKMFGKLAFISQGIVQYLGRHDAAVQNIGKATFRVLGLVALLYEL